MKQELLEAIEKLLKAEIINAKEYTQMVIRVKSSNNSVQGEISNVSDNEKQRKFVNKLLDKIHDMDPEYSEIVNKEFWNLLNYAVKPTDL